MTKSTKVQTRSHQWYGWLPDLPDHRDLLFAAIKPKAKKLPTSVDLRAGCSAIENQQSLGSCTANALVGVLEFLDKKAGSASIDLSRLFVYYNERVIEGTVKSDDGAFLRDGIKTLAKQGVCSEKTWPYKLTAFARKPTPACYREGLRHTIASYHRLNKVDEMRACLADGFPFVFGFTVYEAFESEAVAKSGVLNMPQASEKTVGGHAVMAVGYDNAKKRFLIRNSWDTDWGQAGYFTMPYDYLADRDLSDDFWTIRP